MCVFAGINLIHKFELQKGQIPLPVCFVACEMSHYVLLVVQHSLCASVISETTPVPAPVSLHFQTGLQRGVRKVVGQLVR
ncbi:hypothetical protein DVA81_18365, partial [Acinetobacter baumannii]